MTIDVQGSSPSVADVAVVTEGAAREIKLERLHYGKLAAGADLSIPADEGYGVTRRSLGLDPAFDGALSPPRLIGTRRLNRDLVDEAARRRGFLLARAAPDWPGAGEPPLALLRARFRHEDGDNGQGRLYQQSAVWLADFATLATPSRRIAAARRRGTRGASGSRRGKRGGSVGLPAAHAPPSLAAKSRAGGRNRDPARRADASRANGGRLPRHLRRAVAILKARRSFSRRSAPRCGNCRETIRAGAISSFYRDCASAFPACACVFCRPIAERRIRTLSRNEQMAPADVYPQIPMLPSRPARTFGFPTSPIAHVISACRIPSGSPRSHRPLSAPVEPRIAAH